MPGLAPDSVEVVELRRGTSYVVVRSGVEESSCSTRAAGLSAGAGRLEAIGRHLAPARASQWGDTASLEAARLERG